MSCLDGEIVTATNILTFWCCVPDPERRTLWTLADLYPAIPSFYPYQNITDLLTLYGADLPEQRMQVMRTQWAFVDAPNNGVECTPQSPCFLIRSCLYIEQVYQAKLLGQIIRDPEQGPPCYYAAVMPSL